MPGISSLADLGTGSVEYAVGFGLGVALGRALGPLATSLSQEAYTVDPSLALDPQDAAAIVAQALQTIGWGEGEAAAHGINAGRFALLEELQVRAPAVGELLDMIRRSTASDADVTHGLRKAQLDPRYDAAIRQLANRPLDGAEIANAIHRGNMDAAGLLLVAAPTTPGDIPQYPVSPLDPVTQAAWSGTSKEQLAVLVANAGLPLGLMQMLELYNRGFMTADDVKRGIAHSNLRNEYMDVALQLARYVLSPTEYAELRLRGWINDQAMYAGGALRGVEQPDMDLLFKLHGRPIPVHQVTTGLARGGTYNGATDSIPEAYLRAMEQGSSRPEWYNLEFANRYTIPSYFVLKQILADGGITEAELADYFKQEAYPPDLADKAAKAIAGGVAGTSGPYTKKAETQLWTATHKAYVDALIDDTQATANLAALGAAAADIEGVLRLWKLDAATPRKTLTLKETVGAEAQPGKGQSWVELRLAELGYTKDDIATLLYTPPATAPAA